MTTAGANDAMKRFEDSKEVQPRRSCNRHDDCDEAERRFMESARLKNLWPREPGANFHCHVDDCEDCFGK